MTSDTQPSQLPRMIDSQMALAREWDELVEQVRQLPGFEDFLRPPRLETLLPAAAEGPVVVVNVSRWRCDALLVTRHGVQVVELPELTAEAVMRRTQEYLRVLNNADEVHATYQTAWQLYDGGDRSFAAVQQYGVAREGMLLAQRTKETMLTELLEWLWHVIAEPVLTALGFTGAPEPGEPWPRLWWCPTGLLTLLPLHAAGLHRAADTHDRSVMDRVASSYAPTLRALLEARKSDRKEGEPGRMLIVAVPNPPGEPELVSVVSARQQLPVLFPGDSHTLLEGEAATPVAVLEQMARHSRVHFSCHGNQDLTDPSRGGLLLTGGVLAITEIIAERYQGDFMFLAACKTATGGINLPDETITLAAALHHAGYRHVIGTLWSVYDDTAAQISESVYAELTATGEFIPDRAAVALHLAVRRMRDAYPDIPSAWIPYTHIGP